MKKRSILSLVLAALMAGSIFAGCGSPSSSSSSAAGDGSETSTSSASSAASTSETAEDGDKPTLKHLLINGTEDYNTYPVAETIQRVTGYTVQYDMLPKDQAADKLKLIMASEEEYDMVTYGGDADLVTNYAQNGALTDISPYLESAPNLDASLSDYERETFTLEDGGLYAIGMESLSFDGVGEVREALFIRKDWLDDLGLEVPTTTDELVEVLRAFKDYDNGTGNEVIPMTLNGSNVTLSGLLGAFGIPNDWNEVDGQLVHRVADPRMKDYLSFLESLYEEGLLDAEFPANKAENQLEKYTNGISGVAYFGYWDCPTLYDTMDQTQPGHEQAFIPYLVGPNGDSGIGTTVSNGFDRICFIPKASQHVEDVIQFMNAYLEEDNFREICIGEEGVHYTIDENGEYWPISPTFFDERSLANNYDVSRLPIYSEYWMCRAKKDERQWNCWQALNRNEEVTDQNVVSPASGAPVFPETSKNKQSLDQMVLDQQIKIIAGSETVDSWDAFVEEWMAAGGEAMTQEYNDWYAAK